MAGLIRRISETLTGMLKTCEHACAVNELINDSDTDSSSDDEPAEPSKPSPRAKCKKCGSTVPPGNQEFCAQHQFMKEEADWQRSQKPVRRITKRQPVLQPTQPEDVPPPAEQPAAEVEVAPPSTKKKNTKRKRGA